MHKRCYMLELIVDKAQSLKDFTDTNYAQASFCFHTLLKNKEIKINGKKVSENVALNVGDTVQYFLTQKQADKPAFYTVYQNENVLIIDKESGVNSESVFAALARKYGEKCRFIHRLDRNTRGLMIFAFGDVAERVLLDAFKERSVEKIYHALCVGKFRDKEKVLTAYLKKDEKKSLVQVFDKQVIGSEKIVTEYKVVEEMDGLSKVEVRLHTGRTHQIRAHLSHIGNPVLGDMKYGNEAENKRRGISRQALVAKQLIFHLTGAWSYLNAKSFISKFEI